VKLSGLVDEVVEGLAPGSEVIAELLTHVDGLRDGLLNRSASDVSVGRILDLLDLVVTSVRGILVDGLIVGPMGFPAIDHLDFREWLSSHGALGSTVDSALVRGLYDLVFAYEEGDPERPSFSAGLGLFLAGKLFFDYRGSLFWKMSAGMGDIVFAPMLQLLRRRGVRVEFLHEVDHLELAAEGDRLSAVHLRRQGRPAGGRSELDPLVSFGGIPCFPSVLPADRIDSEAVATLEYELHGGGPDGEQICLRDGIDFDVVVLGISIGMIPVVGAELIERMPAWQRMINSVRTVPTQALQIWLGPDERTLGWPADGAVVSAYVTPFDTFASMSHLLDVEGWPDDDRPRTIAYFCSALTQVDGEDAADAKGRVRSHAHRFLEHDVGQFFPLASPDGYGFDWTMLRGVGGAAGADRLGTQHLVASIDPSDRYVQSLPGSGKHRLRADQSGVANLVLAGDWVATGLDAGCLESAALAGVQAANAVRGRPLRQGVIGTWPGEQHDRQS
jgi:uncharacterized protein with NAD-binding domain and iron-sulfur cluster